MKVILLLYLCVFGDALHDIHVSVSDIEVREDKIEITFKTFLDDLQLAMGLHPGQDLPKGYTSSDEMITSYIKATNNLKINQQKLNLHISSIDAAADAVWITIEVPDLVDMASDLEWSSTFLTELYNDQTNIVNIKYKGKRKVFTLDKKKQKVEYSL